MSRAISNTSAELPLTDRAEIKTSAAMRGAAAAACTLVVVASALILVRFHDQFWLPRDDGYYAHIAQRMLQGDVLHRDVHALHSGYGYFANAFAMWLFGETMVSLRYPLVLLGIMQALGLFLLMLPKGIGPAMVAALALSTLSFVQFPDPTAHWYAQFLFVGLLAVIMRWEGAGRIAMIGYILALMLLTRQLTGVIVCIGTLAYLLWEIDDAKGGARLIARGLVAVMVAGLGAYILLKSDWLGILLFGVWPLALLIHVGIVTRASDRATLRLIGRLAFGFAIGAAPLVAYHALTGSLADWFRDSFIDAVGVSASAHIGKPTYLVYLIVAPMRIFQADSFGQVVNAVFWPILTLQAALLGGLVIRRVRQGSTPQDLALPFLAVFYGVVALHYQDSAYLFVVMGTTVAGILWVTASSVQSLRIGWLTSAAFLATVALAYHAGESYGVRRQILGSHVEQVPAIGLERVGLRINRDDLATYRAIVADIEANSKRGDAILAIPAGPEFFFLTQRRNPLPYSYVNYGVLSERTLARTLERLRLDPPKVVIHIPVLPYNTPYTDRIMAGVRANYDLIGEYREHLVYRLR